MTNESTRKAIETLLGIVDAQDAGYLSCDASFERGYRTALDVCRKALRAALPEQEIPVTEEMLRVGYASDDKHCAYPRPYRLAAVYRAMRALEPKREGGQ